MTESDSTPSEPSFDPEATWSDESEWELTDDEVAAVEELSAPPPVVAVVGRPNVGKSTLVNRILGRREAVVQDIPGVTRDRVSYDANWLGRRFMVQPHGIDHLGSEVPARADLGADLGMIRAALGPFGIDHLAVVFMAMRIGPLERLR